MDATDDMFEDAREKAMAAATAYVHFPQHAENVVAAFLGSMLQQGFMLQPIDGSAADEVARLKAEIASQREALDWYRRMSDLDFMGGK